MHTKIPSRSRLSPQECADSWSVIYQRTLEVRKAWPSIWMVPFVDDTADLFTTEMPESGTLLEVGASNSSTLKQRLAKARPDIRCFSFDIDRRTRQDFYAWEEIRQTFDAAGCFEVIEHIPVAGGLELCGRVFEQLNPGGTFVIGTPNIFHPTRYLQDPTHVTPWCYDRLGGALLALGFDLCGIARQRSTSQTRRWRARLMNLVAAKLRPYLGLDVADSIYVIARRPK